MISPSKVGALPAIAFYDTDFTFEKTGIGQGLSVTSEETKDELSGDGNNTKFKLKNIALRPLISVEVPAGNKLMESSEYTVDYLKSEISFRTAPSKAPKGKTNIFVTYSMMKSAGESRGIRLKINCNFDIWAKNLAQSDELTLRLVRSILFAEDSLISKGISFTLLGGTLITSEDGSKLKDLFARRLLCRVETDIHFVDKVPRMEKIELTKKKI
jgi:hypothetical protein